MLERRELTLFSNSFLRGAIAHPLMIVWQFIRPSQGSSQVGSGGGSVGDSVGGLVGVSVGGSVTAPLQASFHPIFCHFGLFKMSLTQ